MAKQAWEAGTNQEATEAWDGPLFERFVQFRDVLTGGLGRHGAAALKLHPPAAGARVLDIGCGFGDMSQQIAAVVGGDGDVVGVDVAERFITTATEEAAQAGLRNLRFAAADVEVDNLGGPYDCAYSRFGTMFFANPVAALRNVASALQPGGQLVMVVWRRKLDNGWLHRGEAITKEIVQTPEETEEPTCGPGPFSMADADTTSAILGNAGFKEITFTRCDIPIWMGADLEAAVDAVMALGPAGEMLRLAGDTIADRLDEVRAALRDGYGDFAGPDGIVAPASTWIVSARAASG